MSQNLAEFLKVFTLVFSFSSLLVLGRRYIDKLDEVKKKRPHDNIPESSESSTDFIDYDGMGNYGRFPTPHKKSAQ